VKRRILPAAALPGRPKDELAAGGFPPLKELADKTLFVHCLMIAAFHSDPSRYRRKVWQRAWA